VHVTGMCGRDFIARPEVDTLEAKGTAT
jgi:hypothetical protein